MTVMPKLEYRIARHMVEIERSGLMRSLRVPSRIDLSSNDYLGLSRHRLITRRMAGAVILQGCGSTGSRLLRGDRRVFAQIEERFARWKGSEDSLFFGSGYLANIAVLSTFLDEGDTVFSDELNHASLIDGLRLSKARRVIFPHCDSNALRLLIAQEKALGCKGQMFVVTESLFSMDGDEAPLKEYAAICRANHAALIVDEAHAVGVYGMKGSGLIEERCVEEDVFISINTCGKALGIGGAFVCGRGWAIDYLIQRARPFIYSTAPPPAMAEAIDEALNVISEQPQMRSNLLRQAHHFRGLLREADFALSEGSSQIIPVIIGGAQESANVAERLFQAGFDVRAIRPPTVRPGTSRLRLSVNLQLTEGLASNFVDVLRRAIESGRRLMG